MNESEKQLQDFLEFKFQGGYETWLKLSPQGDANIICPEPVNLCTVTIKDQQFLFGGISEKFYDEMVRKFDPRG